jgi:O-antigen/teichoic acid export membrane protein
LALGVLGAALAMGGLPDATTRHAASDTEAKFGRGNVRRSLVRFAATLPLITGLLVLIAYSSPGSVDAAIIVASLLLAVTQGATTIVASIFRARGQAARFAFVTVFFTSAGRAVVAAGALVFGASSGLVLWLFVLLNVALIAFTWHAAVSGLPDTASRAEGDASMQLGGVVWSLLGNLDVVVVGAVLGAGSAGQYGAALRLAEFSIQFLIAFAVLYLPEATKLAVADRPAALRALYQTTCRWSALITLLAAGVGFVAAPALAHIIFPHDPSTTATLLRILFAGYALHGALGQTYSTLIAIGAYRDVRVSSIVALPTVVLGTIGLTEAFGLVGAASATCSAYAVLGICWALLVAHRLRVGPFDEFYVRAVVACVASLAVAVVVALATAGAPPAGSVVAIGFAALLTWTILLPFSGGLSPRERVFVGRLRARWAAPRGQGA